MPFSLHLIQYLGILSVLYPYNEYVLPHLHLLSLMLIIPSFLQHITVVSFGKPKQGLTPHLHFTSDNSTCVIITYTNDLHLM